MTKNEREQIIALIQQEVVPAIGCTEPIAVALAVAKATETLGTTPEQIDVLLSGNMLKNAMGVGIPGTGMVGLPIAIALGALVGKSEKILLPRPLNKENNIFRNNEFILVKKRIRKKNSILKLRLKTGKTLPQSLFRTSIPTSASLPKTARATCRSKRQSMQKGLC